MTVPPSSSTASILICAAVLGITIWAGTPRFAAASATPWAWLPAEEHITPLAIASVLAEKIAFAAPRTLKENTGWVSSRFSRICVSSFADSRGASTNGVRMAA